MLVKIAILGPESTGKTQLASGLAEHFNTAFVPEYSREYFENREYRYTMDDLVEIAVGQIKNESLFSMSDGLLFYDTEQITISIWSQVVYNKVPEFITEKVSLQKYDLYLLSNLDVKWESDPLRNNSYNRQYIYDLFVKELDRNGCNYKVVSGTDDDRLKNAINFVEEYLTNAR